MGLDGLMEGVQQRSFKLSNSFLNVVWLSKLQRWKTKVVFCWYLICCVTLYSDQTVQQIIAWMPRWTFACFFYFVNIFAAGSHLSEWFFKMFLRFTASSRIPVYMLMDPYHRATLVCVWWQWCDGLSHQTSTAEGKTTPGVCHRLVCSAVLSPSLYYLLFFRLPEPRLLPPASSLSLLHPCLTPPLSGVSRGFCLFDFAVVRKTLRRSQTDKDDERLAYLFY